MLKMLKFGRRKAEWKEGRAGEANAQRCIKGARTRVLCSSRSAKILPIFAPPHAVCSPSSSAAQDGLDASPGHGGERRRAKTRRRGSVCLCVSVPACIPQRTTEHVECGFAGARCIGRCTTAPIFICSVRALFALSSAKPSPRSVGEGCPGKGVARTWGNVLLFFFSAIQGWHNSAALHAGQVSECER